MPAHILWDRITRTSKKKREEAEVDYRKWVLEQLNFTRGITFALRVCGDVPPSWEDIERQWSGKKPKKPTKGKVDKSRRSFEEMFERHEVGISSPYHFEEYMGLASSDGKGHVFEKPPPERVKTSKEFKAEQKKQVSAMEQRILGKLDRFAQKHGADTTFDEIMQPSY